jgi:hypothetical protein
VLATIRESVAFPAGNQEETALAALEHLAALSADKVGALYVYFTPGGGQRLTSPEWPGCYPFCARLRPPIKLLTQRLATTPNEAMLGMLVLPPPVVYPD